MSLLHTGMVIITEDIPINLNLSYYCNVVFSEIENNKTF